jgi:hypothetical protein
VGIEEERAWLRAERSRLQRRESDLHAEHEQAESELLRALAAHRAFLERLETHRRELEDFHRKLDDFHKRVGSVD